MHRLVVQIDARNLTVVQELAAWPRALRRVSVNSFGYGGANSHSIMESLDSYLGLQQLEILPSMTGVPRPIEQFENQHTGERTRHFLLPVSAATRQALETRVQQVTQTVTRLQTNPQRLEHEMQDLAYTLAQRRSHMELRQVLLFEMKTVRGGQPELVQLDVEDDNKGQASSNSSNPLPFGFVFTGQGAQWPEMGKELLETNSTFRSTIRNIDRILQSLPRSQAPDWTIEQTLLDPPTSSQIHHVTRSQPVCTALQIALVDMLETWGIRSAAVIGHSSGEIAAAYAAGLLSTEQAILTAYFRGIAVATLQHPGAMMAVGMGPKAAHDLIQESDLCDQVCVACVNSPESVTLSGSEASIEILLAKLQVQNKYARKLQTGGRAYHSFMMKEAGALYEDLLTPYLKPDDNDKSVVPKGTSGTSEHVSMFSSVGVDAEHIATADHNSTCSAEYWRQNLERPVQFWQAAQNMISTYSSAGKGLHLVEVGPHSALKGPLRQIRNHMGLNETLIPYACALIRSQDADFSVKKLAAAHFLHGADLAWKDINDVAESDRQRRKPKLVHLQPYPWDYSGGLLWTEPRVSVETRNRSFIRHPLLGSLRVAGSGLDWQWKNQLSLREIPWLRDHRVEAQIVFPAAGFIAMSIEGLSQILHLRHTSDEKNEINTNRGRPRWFEFRNVSISAALVVHGEEDETGSANPVELHTAMAPRVLSTTTASADWHDFTISSWVAGKAKAHCSGSIRAHEADDDMSAKTVTIQRSEGFEPQATGSAAPYYRKFEQEGLCLGPSFQSISKIDGNRSYREVTASTLLRPQAQLDARLDQHERDQDSIHPITIDACIQAGIMSTAAGDVNDVGAHLPVAIRECWVRGFCDGDSNDLDHPKDTDNSNYAPIEARARRTGVSSHRVDATLRHPRTAVPLVHLRDVLVTQYRAKVPSSDLQSVARQPCLRISWKPDLLHLRAGSGLALARHLADFVDGLPNALPDSDLPENPGTAKIAALLDLAGHRNPSMRVLELSEGCTCKAGQWHAVLGYGTGAQRYQSWDTISLSPDVQDSSANVAALKASAMKDPFDVVLLTGVSPNSSF